MGWKIYAWSFLTLNVAWFVCLAFGVGPSVDLNAIHWVDVPISLVALLGVLGFAHRRRIATRGFWWTWLAVAVVWDVLGNFGLLDRWTDPSFDATVTDMLVSGTIRSTIGLLPVLPAYVGLVLYARRWSHLLADEAREPHPTAGEPEAQRLG